MLSSSNEGYMCLCNTNLETWICFHETNKESVIVISGLLVVGANSMNDHDELVSREKTSEVVH